MADVTPFTPGEAEAFLERAKRRVDAALQNPAVQSNLLEYRRKLERRKAIGDPVVISMQNERDASYKRARDEQRDRQFTTALASALRQIYMVHGDTCVSDAIKINAEIEARKILSCQT